jgi:hypothetical protein
MFVGLVLGFLLASVLFIATGGMIIVAGIGYYIYSTRSVACTDG